MKEVPEFTEATAALAYAQAWNRLDCTEFVKLLAPDAKYASFWVFSELEDRDAITEYLTAKMRAVAAGTDKVSAELATTTTGFGSSGKPCVAITQAKKKVFSAIVLFEVEDGLITRIDMSAPEFFGAVRSGVYPS